MELCFVVRDEKGSIIRKHIKWVWARSTMAVEALAVREAMFLIKESGWRRVLVESDCLNLVKMCLGMISSLVR